MLITCAKKREDAQLTYNWVALMVDNVSDNNEPVARHNTRANLERLLNKITAEPERQDEITQDIESIFGQDKAVLALDMSGFSRMTHRHGIVYFLLMIQQMALVVKPVIQEHGGLLVKAEADNFFCLFDTTADAVRTAGEIVQRLNAVNILLPEDRHLYASIGIGYGRILNIDDQDLFGDEVNLACKLGEDIAGKGAILLTPAARHQLPNDEVQTREETLSISGLSLSYYVVEGGE